MDVYTEQNGKDFSIFPLFFPFKYFAKQGKVAVDVKPLPNLSNRSA